MAPPTRPPVPRRCDPRTTVCGSSRRRSATTPVWWAPVSSASRPSTGCGSAAPRLRDADREPRRRHPPRARGVARRGRRPVRGHAPDDDPPRSLRDPRAEPGERASPQRGPSGTRADTPPSCGRDACPRLGRGPPRRQRSREPPHRGGARRGCRGDGPPRGRAPSRRRSSRAGSASGSTGSSGSYRGARSSSRRSGRSREAGPTRRSRSSRRSG